MNPGLQSRFNKFIHFQDYSPEELLRIFCKMCADNGYESTPELLDRMRKIFAEEFQRRERDFANARSARNFFERIIASHSNRIAGIASPSDKDLITLQAEDAGGPTEPRPSQSASRGESGTAYNTAASPKQQLATKRIASGGTILAASLGIEAIGGVSTRLIKAGTPLPCRLSEIFSTASDNQPGVEIHVLQGERALARDNKTIGKFHLTGLLPVPRDVPQIEVTFDVDANGMLYVSAKDLGTGKEQKIIITGSSGLTNQEVEDLRRDAEAHANEDPRQSEEIALRNKADGALYRCEKMLRELREDLHKIASTEKTKIENAMNAVEEALKGTDASAIHSTTQQLDEA